MSKFSLFIAALLSTIPYSTCIAETKLHITTGFTPPVSDFFNSILEEADKRLEDISITFEVMPAERSLVLVNEGINDGECCRIPAVISPEYENIKPINECFYTARFSAFTKSNDANVKSFNDLKPFTVGSVSGWKIAVNNIKAVEPAEVHIVTTLEQMFTMLDQDRLDFGVVGYLSGLHAISELKLKNINVINPPLIEKQLYLLLHKKHKDLMPVFDKVFIEMRDDGTIDRLYDNLKESL